MILSPPSELQMSSHPMVGFAEDIPTERELRNATRRILRWIDKEAASFCLLGEGRAIYAFNADLGITISDQSFYCTKVTLPASEREEWGRIVVKAYRMLARHIKRDKEAKNEPDV